MAKGNRMKYKLIAFDMDGTIIQIKDCGNSWDLIRKIYGIPNFWKEYKEGRMSREQSKEAEYNIWAEKGVRKEKLKSDFIKHAKVVKGTYKLFDELHKRGIATAIISDAPCIIVRRFAEKLKAKYVACNDILFDEKGIAYDTVPTHSAKNIRVSKSIALRDFAKKEGISLKECVAVGNSLNDAEMFEEAGLSIAFNSCDQAEIDADITIESDDITTILNHLQ